MQTENVTPAAPAATPAAFKMAWVWWGIAGLVALLLMFGDEKPTTTSAAPTAPSSSELIAMTQAAVKSSMKDPSSTQFANVYVRGPVVCGTVSSKNSFGGRSGFQRFVGTGGVYFLEEQLGATEMAKVWSAKC